VRVGEAVGKALLILLCMCGTSCSQGFQLQPRVPAAALGVESQRLLLVVIELGRQCITDCSLTIVGLTELPLPGDNERHVHVD
jgi:hypothetical protein